jgi:hypothetical protein
MRTAIGPGGAGSPGDGGGLGTVEADAPPAADTGDGGGLGTVEADAPPAADTGDGGGLGTVQAGAPPGALTPATAATLDAIAVWQIGLTDYPI